MSDEVKDPSVERVEGAEPDDFGTAPPPETAVAESSAGVGTGADAPEAVDGAWPSVASDPGVERAPADETPGSAVAAPATASDSAADGVPVAVHAEPGKKPIDREAAFLYRAMRSRRAVDAVVTALIKGGYELRLGRHTRGFCPRSQMDVHPTDAPETLVGRKLAFRITQIRRAGTDVVVSRRALLEATRLEEAKAVRATLIEGSVTQGRVAGLAEFGAFVDLGAGVMGLAHVSELAHSPVRRASDAVKVGDSVMVKILKLDDERGRVSLSVRQATPDPWDQVEARFPAGSVVSGEVLRLADFGAFVQLAPGIDALAPAVEMPPSSLGWQHGLEPGVQRDWVVLHVDGGARRIALTLPVEGYDPASVAALEVGAPLSGRVQRVERFGVFVWLGPGRVGLLPGALAGAATGGFPERRYDVGDAIEVEVLELGDHGRIRLAPRGYAARPRRPAADVAAPPRRPGRSERPARPARRSPAEQAPARVPDSVTGTFGTSLGDKLRAALDRSGR